MVEDSEFSTSRVPYINIYSPPVRAQTQAAAIATLALVLSINLLLSFRFVIYCWDDCYLNLSFAVYAKIGYQSFAI